MHARNVGKEISIRIPQIYHLLSVAVAKRRWQFLFDQMRLGEPMEEDWMTNLRKEKKGAGVLV